MRSLLLMSALTILFGWTAPASAGGAIEPTGPPAPTTSSHTGSSPTGSSPTEPTAAGPDAPPSQPDISSRFDTGTFRFGVHVGAILIPEEFLYSPEVSADVTGRLSLRRADAAIPVHAFLRQQGTFQVLHLAPAGRTVAGIEVFHRLQLAAGVDYVYAPPQGEFLEESGIAPVVEVAYRTRLWSVVVPVRAYIIESSDSGREGAGGFSIGAEF